MSRNTPDAINGQDVALALGVLKMRIQDKAQADAFAKTVEGGAIVRIVEALVALDHVLQGFERRLRDLEKRAAPVIEDHERRELADLS